ncbi:MAG: thioredoxin [Alphaproteobacteria bacterium]|nr:thioredoxin [Alphaproteobacteria bacterium]
MAIIIGPGNTSPGASTKAPEGGDEPLVGGTGPASAQPDAQSGGGAAELVKESTSASFMTDVIEASKEVPIIVDFWAPWCEPCKKLGPMLEKLVRQAGGLVRMVKVNIDENQDLAAQMRIQSIPMVYAFSQGQPVDGFQGAVPESQLKEFIGRLTDGAKLPVDAALEEAEVALEAGDVEGASTIFAQVLEQDGTNGPAIAGLIRCTTATGEYDHAREIIDGLTPELQKDTAVTAAVAALELAEQSGTPDASATVALMAQLEADPNNHQARLDLAVALYGSGQSEQAIEELVEIIRRDLTWNDDAARTQLLKIFEALGHSHPATIEGRRQLSAVLFS